MCIQQSRLDDIQQDICTEGEKLFFMSRRKGRYERRQTKREANKIKRCQEVGGLNDVFTYHDMFLSGRKCCNGVRWKNSAQRFELHLFSGTAARRREILEHKWKPSKYVHFTISERGKTRPIDAPCIQDRQMQKVFYPKSFVAVVPTRNDMEQRCKSAWERF